MSTPFNPKKFLAAATTFLEAKRAAWLKDMIGSPQEPHAIAYALQEGWIMPGEGLESVSILNLFPNAWPNDWAMKVQTTQTTEKQAKIKLAAAMSSDLSEANTAISRLAWGETAPPAPQEAIPATLTPEPTIQPPPQPSGPVKGVPEAVASSAERVHRVSFDGFHCYTLDKAVIETIRAAQVQGIVLAVETAPGDFGQRITKTTVTNP